MKKIIDGKTYNTDTATLIEEVSFSNTGDFRHYREGLYVTKTRNFFVAGAGGPMSHWSRSVGQNEWSGGSGIIAKTKKEVLDWCEQHDVSPEKLEGYIAIEEA